MSTSEGARAAAVVAPLSAAQRQLWFLDQLHGPSAAYNVPYLLRLRGPLDTGALRRALVSVAARHDALRTRVEERPGPDGDHEPVQVIDDAGAPELVEFSAPEDEALRRSTDEGRRPFTLVGEPLVRTWLARIAPDDHVLLVALHHAITDGWSESIVFDDLGRCYDAEIAGAEVAGAEVAGAEVAGAAIPGDAAEGGSGPGERPAQLADHARWQAEWVAGEQCAEQLAYWERRLAGAPPVLTLPVARPRPATPTTAGDVLRFDVGPAVAQRLAALGRERGVSLFVLVVTAYLVLLHRYTRRDDLVVGAPIANRTREEWEGVVGLLVNTVALRVDVSGRPSFATLLDRVRGVFFEAYAHQDVPFELVSRRLGGDREPGVNPVFQVVCNVVDGAREARLAGIDVEVGEVPTRTAKFDLDLTVARRPAGLECSFEYATDLFDAATVERLAGQYRAVLAAMVADVDSSIATVDIRTDAERAADDRRNADAAWPAVTAGPAAAPGAGGGATLHGLVAEQARRTPDAVAVVGPGARVTYRELHERAGRIARGIRARGVRPGATVAVLLPRSPDLVAALLGVLRAGAAFVPLDADDPPARRAATAARAGAALVLDAAALADLPPTEDADDGSADTGDAVDVPANAVAYVIFTSGSTGEPKGVAVPHEAIVGTIRGLQAHYALDDDAVLQSTPLGFDPSIWQVFWPLATGARVVLPPDGAHRDSGRVVDLVRRERVTVLHAVPSMLAVLLEEPGWAGCAGPDGVLRHVLCGGEALPAALAERFAASSTAALSNVYGPAEAAVEATRWRGPVDAAQRARTFVPLGDPNPGVTAHVLDPDGLPVPTGVPGELHLGGAGLAHGYVGAPDATAERFVPDPWGPPGSRLYRTGDVVRRHADGALEHLGRDDRQVKVRGRRVEIGEIEHRLATAPGVRAAAVTARPDPAGGVTLTAHVEPADAAGGDAIRAHLAAVLPEHMTPAVIRGHAALPLSRNGKVDHAALVRLDAAAAPGGPERRDPRRAADEWATPTERAVAAIWAEVFGVDRVARDDHFFRLGGHSLLATKVLARVRARLRLDAPLRSIFDVPVLADFARVLDALRPTGAEAPAGVSGPASGGATAPDAAPGDPETGGAAASASGAVARVADGVPRPLSFAQERLWFLDQFEPDSAVYTVTCAWWLDGDLDLDRLRAALDVVVRRHEPLRTTFVVVDEQPAQVVGPPLPVDVRVVDVPPGPGAATDGTDAMDGAAASDAPDDAVLAAARADAVRPFDLARGPMLRAAVFRAAPRRCLLVLGTHHVAFDDWSKNVLARDLAAAYGGAAETLPALPVRYADHAAAQRARLTGDALRPRIDAWRERLAGAPALLDLPTDRPRPAVQAFRGALVSAVVPARVMAGLRAIAARHDATPFMALLASFTALLGRWAGTDDVVVGTTVAGRDDQDVEDLVGFFVNTLVLRADLAGDPTFVELLARVRAVTLDAYEHQDVPFERLVSELAPQRSLSVPPLVQVLFDLQNLRPEPLRLDGLAARAVDIDKGVAKFDLVVSMVESTDAATDGGLDVEIQYDSDLFDAATARRLLAHWLLVLDQVVAAPGRPIGAVSLVSAAERALLAVWSHGPGADPEPDPDRPSDAPGLVSLAGLVAEQARRTPDAVALVHGQRELTYRALDERANRLAHRLIARGVGPDVRVALDADRSPDALVTVLAILKAGGAYVPIDPAHPQARRAQQARDADVALHVTADDLRGLDGPDDADAAAAPPCRTRAANLAYVLYTSGSTGEPKGVAMTHGAMLNLCAWHAEALPLAPGARVLRFAPLGFDVSCQEVFATWAAGGTLVELTDDDARRDPQALLDVLERERVERWFVPYSALVNVAHWALRESRRRDLRLRVVVTAGEQLQLTNDLRGWVARVGCDLVNHYGPTETHAATAHDVPLPAADDALLPPIGRPIRGARVHVLDRDLRPVPIGLPGEVLIGGAGVARGYAGRSGWTADRFVPDPHGPSGSRLYRTGDLARWLPDGTLEFRGRADAQLKVRGHRVEPGEVEAVLEEHPAVAAAAVTAHGDGPARGLVAYLVGAFGRPDVDHVLAHARTRLPDPLVPGRLVVLDALPTNRNGKLDRAALPDPGPPGRDRAPDAARTPPRTATEQAVARAWHAVLTPAANGAPASGDDAAGAAAFDVGDNFFALGGHSLLATRAVARLRADLGADVPLKSIFEHPTVATLAAAIDALPGREPPITRRPREARSLRR